MSAKDGVALAFQRLLIDTSWHTRIQLKEKYKVRVDAIITGDYISAGLSEDSFRSLWIRRRSQTNGNKALRNGHTQPPEWNEKRENGTHQESRRQDNVIESAENGGQQSEETAASDLLFLFRIQWSSSCRLVPL